MKDMTWSLNTFLMNFFVLRLGHNGRGPNDTKEIDEFSIRTPLMINNLHDDLVSQYKVLPENIKTWVSSSVGSTSQPYEYHSTMGLLHFFPPQTDSRCQILLKKYYAFSLLS
ncbi:hypothetical protein BDF14DRAFT_1291067 [Spinellus fusiger]|nr:hypothetical protein BDF14DRAFT_1291067 [Spinellus fusiger]